MKFGGKSILWSAIALLLLLSMGVPLLNWLTVALIMVPFVVLYATLSRGMFAAHIVPVFLIAFFVPGSGPASVIIGLFFLVPAIVMGHHYRQGKPVRRTMTAVLLTILGLALVELLVFESVFGVSLIREMQDRMQDMLGNVASQGVMSDIWTAENTDMVVKMTVQAIPQALLLMAFAATAVAQYLSRRALAGFGMAVPGMPPAHEWRLPRVLVTYYLIALVVQMFIPSGDSSFLSVALLNLVPLLRMAFTVQAMGFFFFLAHQKGWAKPVPVLISIILLIFPPLSLIGVLDAAFPIRKSFQKH